MKMKQKLSGDVKVTMSLYELTIIQSILCHVTLGSGPQSDVVLAFVDEATNYVSDESLVPLGVTVELDPRYGVDFSINVDKE